MSVRGAGVDWLRACRTFATSVDKISSLLSFGFTQVFRLCRPNLGVRRQKIQGLWAGGPSPHKGPGFNIPTQRLLHRPPFLVFDEKHPVIFYVSTQETATAQQKEIKIPFALKDSFRYNFTQEL